jgi:hypothetical protein
MGIKFALYGMLALAVVTIISLGYVHYIGLVEDNARLRENEVKLMAAIETQKGATAAAMAALSEWKTSREELTKRLDEMASLQVAASEQARKLNDLFAKHDLSKLVLERPAALERRINSGSAAILRLLECSSRPGGQCSNPGTTADGSSSSGSGSPAPAPAEVPDSRPR